MKTNQLFLAVLLNMSIFLIQAGCAAPRKPLLKPLPQTNPVPRTISTGLHSGLGVHARAMSKDWPEGNTIYFVKNEGQVDSRVKYYARTGNATVCFTGEGIYFSFLRFPEIGAADDSAGGNVLPKPHALFRLKSVKAHRETIRLSAIGGLPQARIEGDGLQQGRFNYFVGRDRNQWRTNIPVFEAVIYKEIFPGIDLKFYGENGVLEYDIVVKSGANPAAIRLAYEGIQDLNVDGAGNLIVQLGEGQIVQKLPRIYQTLRTKNLPVEGHYWIDSSGRKSKQFAFGFDVGHYDKQGTVTIDPQIAFSTFLGGSAPGLAGASDTARGIAVDSSGSAYVVGSSVAIDFPTTLGAYDMESPFTGFVTKFSADGSQLVYSTFIGETGGCGSIAVDSGGVAYVMCGTDSKDLPTVNPFQAKLAGGIDGAYLKLSADGSSLLYCTYFGGSGDDGGAGIAIDGSGNMFVAGSTESKDFPIRNAFQPNFAGGLSDVYVAELNAEGNDLIFSTYLGGSRNDGLSGFALSSDLSLYLSGGTTSTDLPVTPGAFQTVYKGIELRGDAFVAKFAPGGASLVFATYLGGTSYEGATTIAVDGTGAAYIAGMTSSSDFPIMNPIQPTLKGFSDAFVSKVSPD